MICRTKGEPKILTGQVLVSRITVLLTFVATVSIALAEAVSSDSVVTKMNEESRLGADNVDIGWEPGTGKHVLYLP